MTIDKDLVAAFIKADTDTQRKCVEVFRTLNGESNIRSKRWTDEEVDVLVKKATRRGKLLTWDQLNSAEQEELMTVLDCSPTRLYRKLWQLHQNQKAEDEALARANRR